MLDGLSDHVSSSCIELLGSPSEPGLQTGAVDVHAFAVFQFSGGPAPTV
jgi:hypothetical protein